MDFESKNTINADSIRAQYNEQIDELEAQVEKTTKDLEEAQASIETL